VRGSLTSLIDAHGVLLLDGGLATELEARGFDLDDPLWSARLLVDSPDAIKAVHLDYLAAGADVVISASYQATLEGFGRRGMNERDAAVMLQRSVELARSAVEEFWKEPAHRLGRPHPLVAASIGPYGAYLANGSEYTGEYDLDEDGLVDFHRPRWHLLASTSADLLACETVPAASEARALSRLLVETDVEAWFSFSCRDGTRLRDGTPIIDCARLLSDCPQVVALGVNCTSPEHVPGLLAELKGATGKPMVVYPNSGEAYDASTKSWQGKASSMSFARASVIWRDAGAQIIGGCCRTGPEDIRRIRDLLRPPE
jgi:homocysteine S-methyltransferase